MREEGQTLDNLLDEYWRRGFDEAVKYVRIASREEFDKWRESAEALDISENSSEEEKALAKRLSAFGAVFPPTVDKICNSVALMSAPPTELDPTVELLKINAIAENAKSIEDELYNLKDKIYILKRMVAYIFYFHDFDGVGELFEKFEHELMQDDDLYNLRYYLMRCDKDSEYYVNAPIP